MYIKVTKLKRHGVIYEYAKIVEGYREGNIVRHRVVMNLGPIRSEADRRRFEKILESLKAGERFVLFNNLCVDRDFDFELTYVVEQLWDKYGISDVLTRAFADGEFEYDAAKIVRLLATHRLHQPSSDLAACEWIKNVAFGGIQDIRPKQVYRALEQLIKRKERIEVGVFKELQRRLGLKADLVFYDLTSSYFEGEGPELAEYGKSRDHRPDRKQLQPDGKAAQELSRIQLVRLGQQDLSEQRRGRQFGSELFERPQRHLPRSAPGFADVLHGFPSSKYDSDLYATTWAISKIFGPAGIFRF